MSQPARELLRSLPSVSSLLEHEEVADWLQGLPRSLVVLSLQSALENFRREILAGRIFEPVDDSVVLAVAEEELLRRSMPSLRRVINATGIVLHTGLGRAPLSAAAIEAVAEGCGGYCSLEIDLETGRRGHRSAHVTELLRELTGAESGMVVNNNAAATLHILHTFARGREVIVSRGQLVEIGGSYRLPDVMSAGGAMLREVGTTNRTRISDYERAISENTALLLRVHTSNYRIVGFTEDVDIASLAALTKRHQLLAVDDLGSGALFDLSAYGLPQEPHVAASIAAGADLVCFSGDKLLGGPQCGIIVGRRALIDELQSGALARALRVDKMTLLALEATLRQYLDRDEALASVPTLAMISATTEELAERASRLSDRLREAAPGERFYVGSDVSLVGGGSMPGQELPTVVVQWRPVACGAEQLARLLRENETPVVCRVRDDALFFDLRTIQDDDLDDLAEAVGAVCAEAGRDDDGPSTGIRLPIL
ncbi:MAG: L-seryl-tRNA(Sec) selenium transferase [Phycisphaerae bacterium]|nr:L-seryl-tRNA(Sec) selenium transferase [Phycisphaerae bacterium]